ncbi:MAG TPA: type II toxin-antitoxin system PemK/MazF family toxin [Bryobacteraceae bacterium]|nr:type II toxin-antitoxin system PemK/MazF family toxin [Bryobacteraceae bacterium]
MVETRLTRKTASHGWPKRGEVYLTALGPALIIQNDTSNPYSAVTMVAAITSTVRLPLSPLYVLLPADPSTGPTVSSVAVFNQIRAVDRKRLINKLGTVDALVLVQVDDAIKAAFGLALSLI